MRADMSRLTAALDEIEAEILSLYPELPEPSATDIAEGGAFGMATMAFPQWLRYVFVPAARQRIADDELPAQSSVGAHAVREFDGDNRADRLVGLLTSFDWLVIAR